MSIVNHIAILLDRSSSMTALASGVIAQYNAQAKQISEQATATGQKTHLSLYTFADAADQPILVEVPLDLVELKPLDRKTYSPVGMTAMLDSIGLAVDQLSRFERGSNDSFLVIVITDGAENHSRKHSWDSIAELVKQKIGTDMWTFALLVPRGHGRALLQRLEIPSGNVQEWDQTDRGVEEYSRVTSAGLSNYFKARATGQRSTQSFFTDLGGVSAAAVVNTLSELSGMRKVLVRPADCDGTDRFGNRTAVIQDFCLKRFGRYVVGEAYYELTKREKVQDTKQLVLENRQSGRQYGGANARKILGLPSFGDVTVTPGDHGEFRIYVNSTSLTRKLIQGTAVLYAK